MSQPKKAYRNIDFLTSPAARQLRILSEYMEPADRLRRQGVRDTIVVYGSARSVSRKDAEDMIQEVFAVPEDKRDDAWAARERKARQKLKLADYYEAGRELSRRLTEWAMARKGPRRYVVATGGGPGMMEAANRGAVEAPGGRTVGFGISLPKVLEPANPFITPELNFEFHYFFMRKFWFMYLAKAVVVMPGGFGTMDELFEVLTLMQTGRMKKEVPMLLFGTEFWNDILDFGAFANWGVINRDDLNLFRITDSVDEAFSFLTTEMERIEKEFHNL